MNARRTLRWAGLLATLMMVQVGINVAAFAEVKEPWQAPEDAKNVKNPVKASPEGLITAERMYEINCASCHGEAATGKGEAANMLSRNPANLKDTQVMRKITDGELFWKITMGRAPMPSYGKKLSETERWELVNYLRQLARHGEYKYRGFLNSNR